MSLFQPALLACLFFHAANAQFLTDFSERIAGTDGSCRPSYLQGARTVAPTGQCTGQCTYQTEPTGTKLWPAYTCENSAGEELGCQCQQCPCPNSTGGPDCLACTADSACPIGQSCDLTGALGSTGINTASCVGHPDDSLFAGMADMCGKKNMPNVGTLFKWNADTGTIFVVIYCNLCTQSDPKFVEISCHSGSQRLDTVDPITGEVEADSPCAKVGLDSPCVQAAGANCQVNMREGMEGSQQTTAQVVAATVMAADVMGVSCKPDAGKEVKLCSVALGPLSMKNLCTGLGVCRAGGPQALVAEKDVEAWKFIVLFCWIAVIVLPFITVLCLQLLRQRDHALGVKAEITPPEMPKIDGALSLRWSGVRCIRAGVPVFDGTSGQVSSTPGSGCLASIMGPSGSGKTTLLTTLAGRGLSSDQGVVSICGVDMDARTRRAHIGYLNQAEVLGACLTVREVLTFSAALRLPNLSRQQRAERVAWTLERLDLNALADARIGDSRQRGISGGQRKRVEIGKELVYAPRIMVLDEPTTGLDAAAALAFVRLLRELADEGRLLLCCLHQPRPEILKLFDVNIELNNHAEVSISLSTKLGGGDQKLSNDVEPVAKHGEAILSRQKSTRAWPVQVSILWQRLWIECTKGSTKAFPSLAVVLCMSLLSGWVFADVKNGFTGVLNRFGSIFFAHLFFAFCGLQTCISWNEDRPRFMQEYMNNCYSRTAYFVANASAYIWWYCFILPLIFTGSVYQMIGFSTAGFYKPMLYFSSICGAAMSASGISLFLVSVTNAVITGMVLSSGVLAVCLLFAGFLLPSRGLPAHTKWLLDLSPFKHSFSAMMINELSGLASIFDVEGYDSFDMQGELWAEQLDIDSSDDSLFHHLWVLALLCVISWVLAAAFWIWKCNICNRQLPELCSSSSGKNESNGEQLTTPAEKEPLQQVSFSELMWRGLSLQLRSGQKVFDGLSGCATSGGPLAILGPSGCGKSSLLGLLAGHGPAGGPFASASAAGQILLDDVDVDQATLRSLVGYVWQDEALHAELTVREVVLFAASLRLKGDKKACRQRVERVLQDLELEGVADSTIGGVRKRGISGGEQRRTAVALELVAARSMLVLDEPTSGLDSNAALKLCQLLAKLGKDGHIVISSIHQPSPEILSLFQRVLVMSWEGRVAYWGTPDQMEAYIERCVPTTSPADFSCAPDRMLDLVSVRGSDCDLLCSAESKLQDQLSQQQAKPLDPKSEKYRSKRPSFWQQFLELFMRECRVALRDKSRVPAHYATAIALSLLLGVMYQLPLNLSPGVIGRFGFFFAIQLMLGFVAMQSLMAFAENYTGCVRECASGYYGLGAFILAKVLVDSLLLRIVPTLVLGLIVYPIVGLQSGRAPLFLICLCFSAQTSSVFCLFIGTLAPQSGSSLAVGVWLQLIFLLLNGALVRGGPEALLAISHFRPSYHMLIGNEFRGIEFFVNVKGVTDEIKKLAEDTPFIGKDALRVMHIQWNVPAQICALVAWVLGYVMLSWLVLEARAYLKRPTVAKGLNQEKTPGGSSSHSSCPEVAVLGAQDEASLVPGDRRGILQV